MDRNSSPSAITISPLNKTYGHVKAVEDVSFTECEGGIFGLLDPNGAGKTTTVECINGLRHPDDGRISVLGLPPAAAFCHASAAVMAACRPNRDQPGNHRSWIHQVNRSRSGRFRP